MSLIMDVCSELLKVDGIEVAEVKISLITHVEFPIAQKAFDAGLAAKQKLERELNWSVGLTTIKAQPRPVFDRLITRKV